MMKMAEKIGRDAGHELMYECSMKAEVDGKKFFDSIKSLPHFDDKEKMEIMREEYVNMKQSKKKKLYVNILIAF